MEKLLKYFFASSCLIISLCCLEYAEAADKKIATVIVGTANLREEPSLDSKGVRFASKGAVLEVTAEFTEPTGKKWYKVKTSGKELWLADKVVEMSVYKAPVIKDKDKKIGSDASERAVKTGEENKKIKEGPGRDEQKVTPDGNIGAVSPKRAEDKSSEIKAVEKKSAKEKIVTVTAGSATLRTKPSADSDADAWVSKGTVLNVLDEYTEPMGRKWYKIKTSKGKKLWIIDKAVRVSEAKQPEAQAGGKETGTDDPAKQIPAEEKRKKEGSREEQKPAPIESANEGAPEGDVKKSRMAGPDRPEEEALQELLDKGNAFFREGKCEDFIAAYLKAMDIVVKQKDLTAEGKLHYNISECYTRLKKYQEALRHLDDAIAMAGKTDNAELEILALIDKSRVSVIMGDKNRAFEILKAASEKANREMFLRTAPEDNLKALISFQMAGVLFQLGEKDKARGKLDYALTVNSDFKMEEDIVALLKTVDVPMHGQIASVNKILDDAWGLYEKGDYQGMEKGSGNALDIAKRLGYKKGAFGGHYYLAMVSVSMEKYDSAIDHALHAQELAEKGLDRMRLGMVYNLTGNIFRQKKAFDKALHYYSRDLDIMRSANNREGESVALNNIGNTLMDKGEYRDALIYYEGSLKAGLEINTSRHFIAQGHLSVGRARNKTGDYPGAEKSIMQAMKIFRELDNTGGEMVCLWELAANYASQGEYKTAVKILEDNLNSAERSGMKQRFIDDIVVYSEKAKDYLKAEKYRKK